MSDLTVVNGRQTEHGAATANQWTLAAMELVKEAVGRLPCPWQRCKTVRGAGRPLKWELCCVRWAISSISSPPFPISSTTHTDLLDIAWQVIRRVI
jgi:hypothetical protein